MKTNIDLDDEMVSRCMWITGLRTKKAVVDEGLRTILRLHGQREVRDLRGRLRWVAPGERPPGEAAAPAKAAASAGPAAGAGAAPAAGGSGDADPR